MASSQDTEITLGTGKLLVLFFGLVAVCALFFALGYSLGRKSEPAVTTASAAVTPQTSPNNNKANGANPPMTFYKSVEQKNANPDLPAATEGKTDPPAQPTNSAPQITLLILQPPFQRPDTTSRSPRSANKKMPTPWWMR